jgi:hypothetical protein
MRGWNIVRTHPIRKTYGRAIPTFIHNGGPLLATINVYADGAIDCWSFVDRELFARKIASGWISTSPSVGSRIGIFNLGSAEIAVGEWLYSPADMHAMVEDTIHELNPTMDGLIDMEGDDTEIRDGVRWAKMDGADARLYRIDVNGKEILGESLPIFVANGDEAIMTQWFIYSDGLTRFGREETLISLDVAAEMIGTGIAGTSAPEGSWITIDGLGKFKSKDEQWWIDPSERIREARDELAMLRGETGTQRKCIDAHKAYKQDPSKANKENLRLAYEAVPKHMRRFCGDMDSKDWPIRRILYGDETG